MEDGLRRRSVVLLSAGLFVLLAQALVPLDEFIHRADDAFYYFKVATNYPELGFWSFDSIHSTNGVQPLWALLLTGVALPLHGLGVTDPEALARVFVAIAALLQFASSMILFRLLAGRVSVGTALVAAGAFLFPLGIVWSRAWGMESSLYAFMLLATIAFFHGRFERSATPGSAIVLGLLLALTALSRLNAGVFVVCLLGYFVLRGRVPLSTRLRLGAVAAVAAGALLVPYFAWNAASTGHLLTVSGSVKAAEADRYLAEAQVDSPLSTEFASRVYSQFGEAIQDFVSARAADALWVVGGRIAVDEAPDLSTLVIVLALVALVPLLAGRPREWLALVRGRFRRLAPFGYVLAFAVLDAAVSVALYPTEIPYAMVRWWMVPAEIVIVVLVATLVAASIGHLATRMVPVRLQLGLATAVVAAVVALHLQQSIAFFWDGKVEHRDWNLSWNDESHRAAAWLDRNVPEDARVGSWNAGVLGYFSERRVVNLDGLINNFDLLPYLREQRIGDYVRQEELAYLSDMESMFDRKRPQLGQLRLRAVYRHYSPFMRDDYVIYEVRG